MRHRAELIAAVDGDCAVGATMPVGGAIAPCARQLSFTALSLTTFALSAHHIPIGVHRLSGTPQKCASSIRINLFPTGICFSPASPLESSPSRARHVHADEHCLRMKVKTVIAPTTKELFFPQNEIVVSKTDLKGRITYANRTFCALAGYSQTELLGQPHSIVRHPDMPRAVFKQLWDAIRGGREIFAYVKNMAKTGDYYWVFAHVTPSYDESRNIVGFHSNRRVPDRTIVETTIIPIYAAILQQEKQQKNGKDAVAAGLDCLTEFLQEKSITYDALMFAA
jgi:PAS domain S-box-containing protein